MVGQLLLLPVGTISLFFPFLAPYSTVAFNPAAVPIISAQHTTQWTSNFQQHAGRRRRRVALRPRDGASNTCIMSSSEAAAAAEVAAAEAAGEGQPEGAVVARDFDPYVTELPDSFEDSIARMSKGTLQAMDEASDGGLLRCR